MSATNLKDLLVEELKDLYHAEGQLVKALPKMAKAAQNEELRKGILNHLEETEGHVRRLEEVFEHLGVPPKTKVCPAMKGLIEEGNEGIKEHDASPLRDALIIASAQKVEHYEIAAYGTARALAEKLEEDDVARLLQETLDEEGEADKKLTEIADTVNEEAFALSGKA
jgi:ferritin-like metal-binding protein YciE